MRVALSLSMLVMVAVLGCGGRKDVNRRGEIKLRGEKPVSLKNRKPGDRLQRGTASWYGKPYHGRRTSNGEVYDMWEMTAAHKTIPFNTRVRVVNRDTGKEAVVRINDRGPFIRGRIIDLSREAARRLGMEGAGIAEVALYLAEEERPRSRAREGRKSRRSEERNPREVLPDGYWTVQVGSFSEEKRARAYADRMQAYHRDVRLVSSEGMFKIRLGNFETKSDAAQLAAFLYDEEIDSWVLFEKR